MIYSDKKYIFKNASTETYTKEKWVYSLIMKDIYSDASFKYRSQ